MIALTDEARDLAAQWFPLAMKCAREAGRRAPGRDDKAVDSAIDGLLSAAARHDPGRPVPFGAFAAFCIRNHIRQGAIRATHRADMLHRAQAIEEVDDPWSIPAPADPPDRRPDEDAVDFERLIAPLDVRYRDLIRMRFADGLTFARIGDRAGCSTPAARERLIDAMDQFCEMIRSGRIEMT